MVTSAIPGVILFFVLLFFGTIAAGYLLGFAGKYSGKLSEWYTNRRLAKKAARQVQWQSDLSSRPLRTPHKPVKGI